MELLLITIAALAAIQLYNSVQLAKMHGSIDAIEIHLIEQQKHQMRLIDELRRGGI
jgi:hypothetical protein